MTSRYKFHISDAVEDQEWDSFLAETPGGHHVQTSLWAQVKATVGMRAVRILVTEDGKLIGGAQILIGNLPIVGTIGYVSRGPLVATDDPLLRKMLLDRPCGAARERGVRHLTIQPPTNGLEMAATLVDEGYRSTSQTVAPPASVVVDLTLPLNEIMSRMHRGTRYDIHLTERQGIRVGGGSETNLDAYCRMVDEKARRQGFRPFRPKYCVPMWWSSELHGYLRLTVAEYEDETIAAQFSIPFGDTTINKLSVWSGRYGKYRPNEMLHWEVTRWSKDLGYSFHDFKGIDPLAAEALSDGDPLSPKLGQSATRFKLGFGGDIRLFPGAYFDAGSAVVRWLHGSGFPRISAWESVRKGAAMLRTRGRPGSGGAKGGYSR